MIICVEPAGANARRSSKLEATSLGAPTATVHTQAPQHDRINMSAPLRSVAKGMKMVKIEALYLGEKAIKMTQNIVIPNSNKKPEGS